MAISIFEKLNAGFNDLPIESGPNVFITTDYAKAISMSSAQALRRLTRLVEDGKVQKVRTRRNGRVVSAWKYVGK